MSRLALSLAVGDYDRMRPIVDGRVPIDGVDPVCLVLTPEEIFPRAVRHGEFDVCELSLATHVVQVARGDSGYVGIPVFPSRAFRHNSVYVRSDRVRRPEDLRGRRVGLPEYQITAAVWVRAFLEDDFGVKPADITWVRGGTETPAGRDEKVALTLPDDVRVEPAPPGKSLAQLLDEGAIDGFHAPQRPSCAATNPNVGRLFPDARAAAMDYYRRTRVFPIMHLVGIRRTLAERHPWLAMSLVKAFVAAKAAVIAKHDENGTLKATLPFVEDALAEARELMGPDFWPYGVAANRAQLDVFLDHHHRQGLSARRVAVDELFCASTLAT